MVSRTERIALTRFCVLLYTSLFSLPSLHGHGTACSDGVDVWRWPITASEVLTGPTSAQSSRRRRRRHFMINDSGWKRVVVAGPNRGGWTPDEAAADAAIASVPACLLQWLRRAISSPRPYPSSADRRRCRFLVGLITIQTPRPTSRSARLLCFRHYSPGAPLPLSLTPLACCGTAVSIQ